jgi:ProP effector
MSNASLKEQLEAVATQLAVTAKKPSLPSKPIINNINKINNKPKPKFTPKPKPKWLDAAQYGVELLRTYFPLCFKQGSEVKPLKKGIKQDLIKRLSEMPNIVTEDKSCMVKSLSFYVNTKLYHKQVVADAARLDLDGLPAGVVTAEEAQYAIDRMQAKLQAKQSTPSTQKEAVPA